MTTRQAYKETVRHEINIMVEDGKAKLSETQIDKLVEIIHDSEEFQQRLGQIIEDEVEFWVHEENALEDLS